MKILLLTGTAYPLPSNNANLLVKLIPYLKQEHELGLLASAQVKQDEALPDTLYGIPVFWTQEIRSTFKRRFVVPATARLRDRHGLSDLPMELTLRDNLKRIRSSFPYDAVLTTIEPYADGTALAKLPASVKKLLYLMDPPAVLVGEYNGTPYRTRALPRILRAADLILTTPAIAAALKEQGWLQDEVRLSVVGFPQIQENPYLKEDRDLRMDPQKINLLFCGSLYAKIRNPEFFLRVVEQLDERFSVWFMGRGCKWMLDRIRFETRAEVAALPQQAYQTALNAMHDADVLVNIGNSIPVHMPSKLLEYINTGKPILNFCKLSDCPSRYYSSRYPNCLDIDENSETPQSAAARTAAFCADAKNRPPLARAEIEALFPDCTPAVIAGRILDYLNGTALTVGSNPASLQIR